MPVLYRSTRAQTPQTFTASQAILQGLSPDGGLFVPEKLPQITLDLKELASLSYQELAFRLLQPFFSDFSESELRDCLNKAYGKNFTSPEITPVILKDGLFYLELFHGPTIAFKDLALQLLPHLLTTAAKKNGSSLQTLILTATSGDTGKAAMAGFADVPETQIIVFYPQDGVSAIQARQMQTQTGANTHVVAITGNFDDAQTKVKEIFDDQSFATKLHTAGFQTSSANSINIGRLFPQMVYYFYAYGQLLKQGQLKAGQKIDFSVPTGNFGDILAGWYAKKLGLPLGRLICASNENNVLTDFFQTGIYDRRREFHVTTSPSMDILVSSNLERLLFYALDKDGAKVAQLMHELKQNGYYTLPKEALAKLQAEFLADFATEDQTAAEIKRVFTKTGYPLDPHTAVASAVAFRHTHTTPLVVVATASPYKFPEAVLEALGHEHASGLKAVKQLHEVIKWPYPQTIQTLFEAPVKEALNCAPEEMPQMIFEILAQVK